MRLFFLLVLCTNLLFAEKEYVILHCRNAGMFSLFDDVLCLLKGYDNDLFAGVQVDFGKEGLYYDRRHGKNWWNYYCHPIRLGKRTNKKRYARGAINTLIDPYETEERTSREESHALISKYIRFKPQVTKKVNDFTKDNFTGAPLICIHYRGTDKITEAPSVDYDQVTQVIDDFLSNGDYQIFVATDEERFLNYLKQRYQDRLCYNKDVRRSTNGKPTFKTDKTPYKGGLEALVDALLLSKGDVLIKTSSNLSRWSSYFNPDCQVIELSHRY